MPPMPTFDAFTADAKANGYDEVVERRWPAQTVLATHAHPFDAMALVVEGEMWLRVGTATRHLRAGDIFEVGRDVPHDERYGADGATYWVARRHVPADGAG